MVCSRCLALLALFVPVARLERGSTSSKEHMIKSRAGHDALKEEELILHLLPRTRTGGEGR